MEILMSVLVGVLFVTGTYLMLARSILRVVLGTAVLSYATYLMLMTVGLLERGASPILHGDVHAITDPLPQALILTAIVIGFGTTAVLLVIAYLNYQAHGTDDLSELRGEEEHEH